MESFRNSNLFEDIVRYVFWTFNESYRLQIIEYISGFDDRELQRCQNLLDNNFIPYDGIGEGNLDEEQFVLKGNRAPYGKQIIVYLSGLLSENFGSGWSQKQFDALSPQCREFSEEQIVSALRDILPIQISKPF